jgi:hypothetical protein
MLAHLEDFDFASLLKYFNVGHILLFYLFDRYFEACLQLSGHLDESELSLAQSLLKCVKIKDITISHHFL